MGDKLKLLDELVPQYALNKKEFDSYKKLCEEENKSIKSIMQDLALQHYSVGGYKITKTVYSLFDFPFINISGGYSHGVFI